VAHMDNLKSEDGPWESNQGPMLQSFYVGLVKVWLTEIDLLLYTPFRSLPSVLPENSMGLQLQASPHALFGNNLPPASLYVNLSRLIERRHQHPTATMALTHLLRRAFRVTDPQH
jgi:hypothetical protein